MRVSRAVPGWAGVWLALAVLTGWSAGHGSALLVGDLRPSDAAPIRAGLGLAVWAVAAGTLIRGWIRARRERRPGVAARWTLAPRGGRGAALLGVAVLLGAVAGLRGASCPSPPAIDARRLPRTGDRAWCLVRIDRVEAQLSTIRWRGYLQSWSGAEGWVRPRSPVAVGGSWDAAARGRYLLLATARSEGTLPGPVLLQVERAWAVEDQSRGQPECAGHAARAARFRADLGDRLIAVLGPDAGTLAARTFLGPDTKVPPGWDGPFRRTGTMHLLSISGFHFSLLGGLLLLALRVILRGARAAKWPAIGLLGGYAWLVGAPAPVQRAWGGTLLLAAGPAWGRAGRVLNSLGMVAAVIPLLQPGFPASPSFVLSFAATAGVILGGRATVAWLDAAKEARTSRLTQPGACRAPARRGRTGIAPGLLALLESGRPVLLALGVSIGATLLTVPWSFHWFGLLYPLGVLANLVAIPAMAVVMAIQVCALTAVAAGAGAGFPFCAAGRLAGESFLSILRALEGPCGGWAWMGSLDRVTALAWTVGGGIALIAAMRGGESTRDRWRREAEGSAPPRAGSGESGARAPSAACMDPAADPTTSSLPAGTQGAHQIPPPVRSTIARAAVWILLVTLPLAAGDARRLRAEGRFARARCELRFLDVGQGDATLVRFSGVTWLVDLGIGSIHGWDRLVPQLLRLGVTRVDRAWVTHGDADHWGGLIDLLASPIRVDTLVLAEGSVPPARMVSAVRSARRPPVLVRVAGGWYRRGTVVWTRVLHPPAGFQPHDTNEGSLVLLLESAPSGDSASVPFRLLLPGDLPRAREEVVLATEDPGEVLVAQVAHHGSRTAGSSEWWESTHPSLAVISVGRGNTYGLPHAETLAEAARRGARILRTDRDGAVRIAFGASGTQVGRSGPS